MHRFTAEFGMGSGGSNALWSSRNSVAIRCLGGGRAKSGISTKTKPHLREQMGFWNLILTMTYSHMGKPHTTIGDASFHY
jgi:hypothetical protein